MAPLAYMRGRTLEDSFIILDEAQKYNKSANEDVLNTSRIWLENDCQWR